VKPFTVVEEGLDFWAGSLGGPDDYDINIRCAMASVGRKGGKKDRRRRWDVLKPRFCQWREASAFWWMLVDHEQSDSDLLS
jgi:hypothetical protein